MINPMAIGNGNLKPWDLFWRAMPTLQGKWTRMPNYRSNKLEDIFIVI